MRGDTTRLPRGTAASGRAPFPPDLPIEGFHVARDGLRLAVGCAHPLAYRLPDSIQAGQILRHLHGTLESTEDADRLASIVDRLSQANALPETVEIDDLEEAEI